MDLGEQSEMNPNPSFRGENQSQFPPQYSYSQGPAAFSIDQDINMGADSFAATVQAHANASLDPSPGNSGSAQSAQSINTSPVGINAPGMAPPPQNAHHPYSPSGARPSIDDGQDGGLSGGDPKRKRSKVSRACDECRRKKVRCDAAAEDGTIKTCSNCTRAGLTCEYSRIPMKRGPSKGYIKELSERVQQVESLQMALSSTPGYRQSLDASTTGLYAEQPYSPDDPMSLKRNFSFSADQRSPFGGPEYHRDRMPSLGGWNSGSPHSSVFRARDRGSIAIAPDQQPTSTNSFAKPFWTPDVEGPPPTKRQKMNPKEVTKPTLDQSSLSQYYKVLNTYLPILPDADAAITIVQKSSALVQHAFLAALQHLTPQKTKLHNGNLDDADVAGEHASVYKTREELEDFMWSSARELPESRPSEDNLLYLWTYLLMAVESEDDLTRLHDGVIPRTILIKQAVDLGWFCVTTGSKQLATSESSWALYTDHFARAWHCATVLARLHALAVGSGNPIPLYSQQKGVPVISQVLSPTGIIVALAAGLLTTVSLVVQDPLPPSQWGHNLDMRHRVVIQEQFDWGIAGRPESAGNEILIEHLRLFVDLLLSRYTSNFHPLDIIIPAAALADALQKDMTATADSHAYNPFSLHFFALTTVTLLEFMQEGNETEMHRMAIGATNTIKEALEQISEKEHIQKNVRQNAETNEKTEPSREALHWANALLKLINERLSIATAVTTNGGESSGGARNAGDGANAAVDFSLLLRHGYLNVLAQQTG